MNKTFGEGSKKVDPESRWRDGGLHYPQAVRIHLGQKGDVGMRVSKHSEELRKMLGYMSRCRRMYSFQCDLQGPGEDLPSSLSKWWFFSDRTVTENPHIFPSQGRVTQAGVKGMDNDIDDMDVRGNSNTRIAGSGVFNWQAYSPKPLRKGRRFGSGPDASGKRF
jgi:hypothetical protein